MHESTALLCASTFVAAKQGSADHYIAAVCHLHRHNLSQCHAGMCCALLWARILEVEGPTNVAAISHGDVHWPTLINGEVLQQQDSSAL